ncbi:taste receptor type 2 member 16-like [Myotis daubentonii]|uniref:taste receptor type 2 member 16-like n=1 Tax=Myotis daubentonii TaxID=98922 RepID=UPI002873C94F|nr:taste receptor type 2 member 16-like [Myotis daubentonii]
MIPSQVTIFFMTIYLLESLTIIVQSSLIVAVLSREWVQVKRLSPVDMILISLGVCRFFLQWSSVLHNFSSYINPDDELWYIGIIWEFTNTLAFWLTSLLAVVYCVKVSSFTYAIFLWLRWRILRLVPWLLLGSVMVSCVTIIVSALRVVFFKSQLISMMQLPGKNTENETLRTFMEKNYIHQLLATSFIPFLLFLISTILLIASLCQHLRQKRHHGTGHSNSSMKAHATALRFLAFFLIFFTSYFFTIIISTTYILTHENSWFWACETIIYATVSIHLTSLMLSSPVLKKVLKVSCCGPKLPEALGTTIP